MVRLNASVACPIDQIELVRNAPPSTRIVTRLSSVETIADVAELIGLLLASPSEVTADVHSMKSKRLGDLGRIQCTWIGRGGSYRSLMTVGPPRI
jgi:hypothetical protein